MPIIAARIDNRLLHGIVATQWTPQYKPQRIMVIDDEYANDPARKASMRIARPADVALSVISRDTAVANFSAGRYDDHTVYVIVKSPSILVDLNAAGQSIPQVVVGGTETPESGVSAIQVSRRAFVLSSDVESYRKLAQDGSKIVVQYVPADHAEPLIPMLDKLEG